MIGGVTEGQTPLEPEEVKDLLIRITTREALNQAEEENILRARLWAEGSPLVRAGLLTEPMIRRVHREMFGAVWRWAGKYRTSERNLGNPWHNLAADIHQLCGNFAFRVQQASEDPDQLAVEFHYQLVGVHAFPNGNGRHARFCADRLVENLGAAAFSWGRDDLTREGDARGRYLSALRQADAGDTVALVRFARS
jgi:Fic-DOC domain mobile mystery protein B